MKKLLINLSIIVMAVSGSAFAYAQTEIPHPTIQITSPVKGDSYGPDPVELLFEIENFTFVSYKNFTVLFPGNPNAGHAHMWVDPAPAGATADTVYEIESPDFHQLGALERGGYNITIELVKNDHTPFSPRVHDDVSFRVSEQTGAGKYAVIKTESVENVGEAPASLRSLILIFSAALAILLIWGLNHLRKKGIIKTEPLEGVYRRVKTLNFPGKSRIKSITRRIYDKLRRKKEPDF